MRQLKHSVITSNSIFLETLGGHKVDDAITEAILVAMEEQSHVQLTLNAYRICVHPNELVEYVKSRSK